MADNEEPKAIDGGSALVPWIHRDEIRCFTVHRIMTDADDKEHPFVLPRRFGPDDDEIALGLYAGGGVFRVTAQGHGGRFMGPARRVFVDGPEKPLTEAPAPGEVLPPAPPAPAPAPAPVGFAATGIPVAQPLPGMPSVSLDIPGLTPEMRAFLGVFSAQQSYVFQATMTATKIAVDAAERGASAERESAGRTIDTAKEVLKAVTGPRIEADGAAIRALSSELGEARTALTNERNAHAETRGKFIAAAVDAARCRVMLELGGQLPSNHTPGFLGAIERIFSLTVEKVGPGFIGMVAGHLGIEPDKLATLTSAATAKQPAALNAAAPI